MSTGTFTTMSTAMSTGAGKRLEKRVGILESLIRDPTITAEFGEFAGKVMGNGMLYKRKRVVAL